MGQGKKGSILSFKYAFEGIVAALKEEPNLKFHLFVAIIILVAAAYFRISPLRWAIIIFTIGTVFTAELTNTAIEAVVDSFTQKEHPTAKYAKDIGAGAVLITSITAVIIGLIIFSPYVIQKFYEIVGFRL